MGVVLILHHLRHGLKKGPPLLSAVLRGHSRCQRSALAALASLGNGSQEGFRLDFVELYAGTAGMSRAMHDAGFLDCGPST